MSVVVILGIRGEVDGREGGRHTRTHSAGLPCTDECALPEIFFRVMGVCQSS